MLCDYIGKDDIKRIVAENLKELRKKKKLTQEELIQDFSEKYGNDLISLRSYKSYESEKSEYIPSIEKLVLLADYFMCSLDYLICNHNSTYNDSFYKKDCLIRLCGLIYSLVLRPVKIIDQNSPYFGNYCFLSFDSEVNLLLDKMEVKSEEKNIKYYKKGEAIKDLIEDYYNIVNEIDDLDDDWSPTFERFNQLLVKSGINPDDYLSNHLMKIEEERRYYKKMKK